MNIIRKDTMSQASHTFVFMALSVVSLAILASFILNLMNLLNINKGKLAVSTEEKKIKTLVTSAVIASGIGLVATGVTWVAVIYHHNVLVGDIPSHF